MEENKSAKLMRKWLNLGDKPIENSETKAIAKTPKKVLKRKSFIAPKKTTPLKLKKPIKPINKKPPKKPAKIPKKPQNDIKSSNKAETKKIVEKPVKKPKKAPKIEKSSLSVPETPTKRWFPGFEQKPPPNAGCVEIPQGDADCLKTLKFVVTGVLNSLEREECVELIQKHGGRVTSAVSGVTSFLVCGDEPGESKVKKATDKNVKIIDEKGLIDLIIKKSKSAVKFEKNNGKNTPLNVTKATDGSKFEPKEEKADPAENQNLCWTEKYRPKNINQIVGNKMCVQRLRAFLKNFYALRDQKQTGAKKDEGKNAALLSGAPGIGKTSAIYALKEDLNLEIIEMNASDVRSRKILNQCMKGTLTNESVTRFFGRSNKRIKVILMEEIDGMSAGDYGGVTELIKFIKDTKFPIVCTCNDRLALKLKSLANHCIDIKFATPTNMQIRDRIEHILGIENIKIPASEISNAINKADCDIRSVINTLEFWAKSKISSLGFNAEPNNDSMAKTKDLGYNAWDAASALFAPAKTCEIGKIITERVRFYFVDQMFVPLLVQENYLLHKPAAKYGDEELDSYVQAAEYLSESDIVGTSIYRNQNFSLMPFYSILGCVMPALTVSGGFRPFRVNFPAWLGKQSAENKKRRLANDAIKRMNPAHSPKSLSSFFTENVESIVRNISQPLLAGGKGGVDEAVTRLVGFGLNKDDFDFFHVLASFECAEIKIETRFKTAFTRRYNTLNKTELNLAKESMSGQKRKRPVRTDTINRFSENDDDNEKDSFIVSDSSEEEVAKKKPKKTIKRAKSKKATNKRKSK